MPYSGPSDPKLPDHVKDLSRDARDMWVTVWNDTYYRCTRDAGTDCEGKAMRAANAVVARARR